MKTYTRKAFRKLVQSLFLQMNHAYVASIQSEDSSDDHDITRWPVVLFNLDGKDIPATVSEYNVVRLRPFVTMANAKDQDQIFSFFVPYITDWVEDGSQYNWYMQKTANGVPYLRYVNDEHRWSPNKENSKPQVQTLPPVTTVTEIVDPNAATVEDNIPMDEGSLDPDITQPPVYKISIYELTEKEKQANIRPLRKAQTEHLFRLLGPSGPILDKDVIEEIATLLQDIQRHVMGVFDIVVEMPGYLTAELVDRAITASGLMTRALRVNGNTYVDRSLVAKVCLDTPRVAGFTQVNATSPIIGIGIAILKSAEEQHVVELGRELVSSVESIAQFLLQKFPNGFTLATPFKPCVNKCLQDHILKLVLNNSELFTVVTWEEAAST